MPDKNEPSSVNIFQTLTTLLAVLLPVLQLLIGTLPSNNSSGTSNNPIILFDAYFTPVSVIAGILAYVFIIAYKNTIYFEFNLNPWKKKHNAEIASEINYVRGTESDNEKAYLQVLKLSNQYKPEIIISPRNVYYLLIPILFFTLIPFLIVGMMTVDVEQISKFWITVQAILYIFSISVVTLLLATFYINETNRMKRERADKEKPHRLKQLLFETNGLSEFPNIEIVSQDVSDNSLASRIRVNSLQDYLILTDSDATVLKSVKPEYEQIDGGES
jgi:hypothetical protein